MPKLLADTLRTAIKRSGMSVNALAEATGVPQPTISRFLSGSDMRLSRAEKIAKFLKLELKQKR